MIAPMMARMNADAEKEAIELLDPAPGSNILVLGFGPGVGIQYLAERDPEMTILGVDPSTAMMRSASKRNKAAIENGRVKLAETTADSIPADDGRFDGALAVNTIQLCEPIESTVAELGRVMAPGSRLVTLTHDWAAAKHAGSSDEWTAATVPAFEKGAFDAVEAGHGKAEKGKIILITATRNSA